MGKRKLSKVLNGVGIATGVIFVVALGHFSSYFGIFLTIGSFVVLIVCLILAHLLDSDEDTGFWPKNPLRDDSFFSIGEESPLRSSSLAIRRT